MRFLLRLLSGCSICAGLLMGQAQAKTQFPAVLPLQQVMPVPQQPNAIVQPMIALQVMLETYALDHDGQYPRSLYELHQAAEKGGYAMHKITRQGKALFPDLEGVRFVDTTRMMSPPAGVKGTFPAQFVWEVRQQQLQTPWLTRADTQMPVQGAVVYVPVLRDNAKDPVQSYVILRTNAQGVYYAEPQWVYFLSNIDLEKSELPEEKAILQWLKRSNPR